MSLNVMVEPDLRVMSQVRLEVFVFRIRTGSRKELNEGW